MVRMAEKKGIYTFCHERIDYFLARTGFLQSFKQLEPI